MAADINGRGDAAFEELYRRYVDRVHSYCFRLLGSREAAEDVTSDVFIAVAHGLKRYRPMEGKSFRTWLFTIAHHHAIDLRAKRRRDAMRQSPLDPNLRDPAQPPEDAAVAADAGRRIRAALDILSAREREVIELDLAGLSSREIGDVLRLKEGAVYAARSRALERLRARLGENARPCGDE